MYKTNSLHIYTETLNIVHMFPSIKMGSINLETVQGKGLEQWFLKVDPFIQLLMLWWL